MKEYHKLVRDRIPQVIRESGAVAATHVATDTEYRTKLYEKLGEEAAEMQQQPSLGEAADILEVLLAICQLEGWSFDEVEQARIRKAEERGTFAQRIILETVSSP